MKINLIMPTIGRIREVSSYIESIENSDKNNFVTDLYILDQNETSLSEHLGNQSDGLTLYIVKSETKGLSLNRNRGLMKLDSGIIGFPDDDCLYYPDSLSKISEYFRENCDVDVVIGRIFDRDKQCNIIKNWPARETVVNKFNFYQLSSSITLFLREKPTLLFDERLGAGALYGSCEDPDFLYRLLKQGKKIMYTPTIEVWHPTPDETTVPLAKVYSYASGFGAFIRKDFDCIKFFLLLGCIVKKSFQLIFENSKFRKGYFNAFYNGLIFGITNGNRD
jgi:GT2 family glycosyltransferase